MTGSFLPGYYSNVSRGKRQQEGIDDAIPCILEPQGSEKAFGTGEMAEKRFALPIVRAPGYILSTIIGAAPHILWSVFP